MVSSGSVSCCVFVLFFHTLGISKTAKGPDFPGPDFPSEWQNLIPAFMPDSCAPLGSGLLGGGVPSLPALDGEPGHVTRSASGCAVSRTGLVPGSSAVTTGDHVPVDCCHSRGPRTSRAPARMAVPMAGTPSQTALWTLVPAPGEAWRRVRSGLRLSTVATEQGILEPAGRPG